MMRKKAISGKNEITKEDLLNDKNNPGLDADHSSSNSSMYPGINNDNDIVSTEDTGRHATQEQEAHTPLDDK